MTVIGAITTEKFACLWTDTRQVVGGALSDSLDGKLRDLGRGAFGVGTGLVQFTGPALDAISTHLEDGLAAVGDAVRDLAQSWEMRETVEALSPEDRDRLETWAAARRSGGKLGKLAVIHRNASGYACFTVDDAGTLERQPHGKLFCSLPPGIAPAAFRPQVLKIWGEGPRGRVAVLNAAARTIAAAAALTDYCSAFVQAVYLTPGQIHRVGPVPAESLLEVAA